MHTFGNLADLDSKFINLCKKKSINIIEDAAESLGSFYIKNKKKKFMLVPLVLLDRYRLMEIR